MKLKRYHTDGLITKRGTCSLNLCISTWQNNSRKWRLFGSIKGLLSKQGWWVSPIYAMVGSNNHMVQIWIAIEINIKVHSEHKRCNAVKLKYYLQLRSKWPIMLILPNGWHSIKSYWRSYLRFLSDFPQLITMSLDKRTKTEWGFRQCVIRV